MSILRKIRESFNLSQERLGEEVNIDLKNIEKWEKSPKKITNNDLSSLAYYFGLSSEALKEAIIGNKADLSTNKYHYTFSDKSSLDGWWGHIGIGVINQTKTQWFPITLNTADRVSSILASYESKGEWVVLDTLNNRTLVFEPSRLKHIWLLDESAEPPNSDWYVPDYFGKPGEFYKALEAFCTQKDGIDLYENEEVSDYSKKDIDNFTEVHDLDHELVRDLLTQTHIHDISGNVQSHLIEADKLAHFLFHIQLETAAILDFSSNEEGYDLYIPSKNISLIDMPKRFVDKSFREIYED
ncbi:helix-turn-helix transcriptional regulator [Methylophilus sp. OH31]|uniref:helix-turn-helix domain-containing protein n=1 Tax=Methylophilus sp. OH31 TaxID=1387312 RepID=UPI000464B01E|nr:helix-turn-helix transcriptional regulator [Methylophilus sp. OH31]